MAETKERASKIYKKRSTMALAWRQLRRNKGAIIGLVLLVLIIVGALIAPIVYDYNTDVIGMNVRERMQWPSAKHICGTDELGRDIFARIVYGARYSLAVGVVAVMIALLWASSSDRLQATSEAFSRISS